MPHSISGCSRGTHPSNGIGTPKTRQAPGPPLRASLLRFALLKASPRRTMMQTATDIEHAAIGEILSIVHLRTGIDFSAYRAPTLHRRILNRMLSVGLNSLERYLEL